MDKAQATTRADFLVKTILEHQQLPPGSGSMAERGKELAQFIGELHGGLVKYYEKVDPADDH